MEWRVDTDLSCSEELRTKLWPNLIESCRSFYWCGSLVCVSICEITKLIQIYVHKLLALRSLCNLFLSRAALNSHQDLVLMIGLGRYVKSSPAYISKILDGVKVWTQRFRFIFTHGLATTISQFEPIVIWEYARAVSEEKKIYWWKNA